MILTDQEVERYARQVVMPEIGEVGQKKLLDAKVLILGAGGLGAPVIAGLAGAGVGHLTVIDDDEVELTNLNRQIIHSMDRLAMNKAESAALFSRSLNPDIQVHVQSGRFNEKNADTLISVKRADRPSYNSNLPIKAVPVWVSNFIASAVCRDPIINVVDPSTPATEQDGA